MVITLLMNDECRSARCRRLILCAPGLYVGQDDQAEDDRTMGKAAHGHAGVALLRPRLHGRCDDQSGAHAPDAVRHSAAAAKPPSCDKLTPHPWSGSAAPARYRRGGANAVSAAARTISAVPMPIS